MNAKNLIKKYWLILTILAVVGVLRFSGLLSNPISLFSDEVDMGYQAYSLIKTGCDYSGFCLPVQFHSFSDVQPPIPIYLISLFNILGINLDLSIRLVSAVFGTLGVLTTFLLVENLVSKKIFNLNLPYVGILSAAVLAFVPWHFTYSRIGFSLALLYFFVTLGLYLFTVFLLTEKYVYFYFSITILGFTPMVYNTAKMAILFYPIFLILLPNAINLINKKVVAKIFLLFLFVPFLVMLIEGGTASRFNYISIFTDPTAKSEVDQQRLRDSGPSAKVGSQTSPLSKIFHNKPLFYFEKLINNYYSLTSTDFLFISGDPNLRHSPKNWGQIYMSMLPAMIIGIYFLIRYGHKRLLIVLTIFTFASLSTSAITRDGGAHASRSFMFLLPLVILAAIGYSFIKQYSKIIFIAMGTMFVVETSFFLHNYWFHYRYESESSWSSGMRELVQKAGTNIDSPVIISPKNEHPLIFYVYYNRFSPKKFQDFVKNNTVFNSTDGKGNLDGTRFGDTNLYIASLIDFKNKKPDQFSSATYYLTRLEYINTDLKTVAKNSDIIKLHSGEPLYYEFKY